MGIRQDADRSDPSPSAEPKRLAIRNSFLWRLYTLAALRTTAKFYKSDGLFTPISKSKSIKRGPFVDPTEAATMKFIADNTSVPVPKVYCSFQRKGTGYIVMERIRGEELPRAWADLSEQRRKAMLAQLRLMFNDLRSIQPTSDRVESCVGNTLTDSRIAHAPLRFGPFETIQKFHLWLRQGIEPAVTSDYKCTDDEWSQIKDMAAKQDGSWPKPVFTHGDLNPFNILVRNGKVVAIIDWEFSGWYPHYWEYTSAWYGNMLHTDWRDRLDEILIPFPDELKMEIVRQKWWGEI